MKQILSMSIGSATIAALIAESICAQVTPPKIRKSAVLILKQELMKVY